MSITGKKQEMKYFYENLRLGNIQLPAFYGTV